MKNSRTRKVNQSGKSAKVNKGRTSQQMQGRRSGGGWKPRGPSRPRGSGFSLPDEEYRIVMDKGLCLQCYKPDHRIQELQRD